MQDQAFPDGLTEPRAADSRDKARPGESKGERKKEAEFELLARLSDANKDGLPHRRRAREPTKNTVAGVIGLALLLVMAGLTIWAVLNAAAARRQARVAFSRQLAAQSRLQIDDGETDLGPLLAVAACSVATTVEVRGALLEGLEGSDPRLEAFLHGHTDRTLSAAFGPDGKTLASGSDDGTVVLWDVGVNSWIAKAKRIANRGLTPNERQQYLVTKRTIVDSFIIACLLLTGTKLGRGR